MTQTIVMMQGPGDVVPLVWTFVLDVFPHSPQNIAIEFSIHRPGGTNFLCMMPSVSKKTNQH